MDLKELHSFKMSDAVTFHDNLNSKLFRGQHLWPEVELQLKNIAQDFLQEMGIHDLDVRDITISGSNAAYSYTDHSDLDLHILVNMKDLPDDDIYREFFKAKKDLYNDTHDITINGIPVELYIQDASEPVVSLGEYSIKDKKWLKLPTKRRANFDQNATKAKYEKLLDVIDTALQSSKIGKVSKVLKKIKQYRQAGLDKGGEFGPENLAYKALRSQGYITKLYDLRDKLHSKHLSLNGMYSNVNEEDLDESFGMGRYQVGNMWFDITKHAIDRVEERNVPISTAKEMLRRISTMNDTIQKMGVGQAFWVYDPSLGISMGIRLLDSGKVQWGTTIIGGPRNRDARYPMVNINESFDKPYELLRWEKGDYGDVDAIARLDDGTFLSIMFNKGYSKDTKEETWSVEFWRNNSQEVTGEGDQQRVFATVLRAIQTFIKKYTPNKIIFAANKVDDTGNDTQSRANLYDKLVQRYAKSWGFKSFRADTGNKVIYELSRIKKDVAEASGYIPSEKQKNDPRFSTALTVDIKPDSIKKNAKAFYWNTSRAGIPPTAKPSGKI